MFLTQYKIKPMSPRNPKKIIESSTDEWGKNSDPYLFPGTSNLTLWSKR